MNVKLHLNFIYSGFFSSKLINVNLIKTIINCSSNPSGANSITISSHGYVNNLINLMV